MPALRATAGVAFEALTAADAAIDRLALLGDGLREQNAPLPHHGRQHLVVELETTRLLRQQGVTRLHSRRLHSRKLRGFERPPFRDHTLSPYFLTKRA